MCLFPLETWKLGSLIVVFLVHIEIHVFCVFQSLGGMGSYDRLFLNCLSTLQLMFFCLFLSFC